MSADRSGDFDVPSSDRAPCSDGADGRVAVEVRDRFEYYESLRVSVAAESWDVAAERFRGKWAAHCERWPAEGRSAVDRSEDPPGSWRGESGRFLDSAANAEVEARCERIGEVEKSVVSPAMREIEACDPERHLVGFEHRLKGLDRLKDKVSAEIEEKGRTTTEALSMVKDPIRYTLVYSDWAYSESVLADVARLKARGFEQVERRNTWTEDQYKGVNSRWRDPDSGQLFEVQFHTNISFEAKQLTHCAYERTRDPTIDRAELRELRRLQGDAGRQIPVPPGAADIPDYPLEEARCKG